MPAWRPREDRVDEAGDHEDEGEQGGDRPGDVLPAGVVVAPADGLPEEVAVEQGPQAQDPQEGQVKQPQRRQQGQQHEHVNPDDGPADPLPEMAHRQAPRRQVGGQHEGHHIVDHQEGCGPPQDRSGDEKGDECEIKPDHRKPEAHRPPRMSVVEFAQLPPDPCKQRALQTSPSMCGAVRLQRVGRRLDSPAEHIPSMAPPT